MSTHAGVFHFNGARSTEGESAVTARLRPWAPDGVSVFQERGLLIAHGALHVWCGDRSSMQPVRTASGLVLVWDGRLDNREELQMRLGLPLGDTTSDGEIAAAMVERGGTDALHSLVGDWAVVVWSSRERTLRLARDYMGVRPLYYHADERAVTWSSSLGELAERSGQRDELSDAFVAGFMSGHLSSDVTPYDGIRAVPAATCVSFSDEGVERRHRFWWMAPGRISFRDRREYDAQLRTLWSDAVAVRLRAHGTVCAELSGGLDSSSVVCMADALIRSRTVQASALQPLSHATLESPEGDERRFIAEVEHRTGRRAEIIGVERHQALRDPDWDWVSPFALRGVGLACAQKARELGGRMVLSGRAGDAVMGCQPDNSVAVFDDVASGQLWTAVANLRRWSLACRKPFVEIGAQIVRAAIAPSTRPAAATRLGGRDLLTPRLRASIGDQPEGTVRSARLAKREMVRLVAGYATGSRFDIPHQPPGLLYTYPFTHRPLVDFMLAIPGEELSAPGDMRSLMRRAFRGLVPDRVLDRVSKGYYPPAALRAVRPLAAAMLPVERLEVVRRGWIDPARLERSIRLLVDGGGGVGAGVRHVLRLEEWLAARQRRGPAVIPRREEVNTNALLNA